MFKHILVPVDGSPTAQKAVEKACALARTYDSTLTVVYVIDPYPFTGLGNDFGYGQAEYLSAATVEARQATGAAQQLCAQAGVNVVVRVVEAHGAWRGILAAADQVGADLIVIGSHGRHGLEKLVLGSETQRVLSHTRLPVLVVRD